MDRCTEEPVIALLQSNRLHSELCALPVHTVPVQSVLLYVCVYVWCCAHCILGGCMKMSVSNSVLQSYVVHIVYGGWCTPCCVSN